MGKSKALRNMRPAWTTRRKEGKETRKAESGKERQSVSTS